MLHYGLESQGVDVENCEGSDKLILASVQILTDVMILNREDGPRIQRDLYR